MMMEAEVEAILGRSHQPQNWQAAPGAGKAGSLWKGRSLLEC